MSLSNIFTPQSIAIIGASAQKGSVGNSILKNLLSHYKGQAFPVNLKNAEILGAKCFLSVLDLPTIPDLAIIVVPAKVVPIVLQQVANKGIKGVVIISAGFREVGGEGLALEDQIKSICVENNISLIGPNCLGVINPWIKMNASFANSFPPKGNIAFVSQSGAICTAVIDYANTLGLGFSKFVSVGNKALSSEVEMLHYLEQDPDTEVIAIYVENLTDAKIIIGAMKNVTKPVVILKSGRTTAGSGASASHTGALASEDVLYETLFRQAGINRANSTEELFEFMQVLSRYPHIYKANTLTLKQMPQKKLQVAIITNAGGPGVLTTDTVIASGMEMAKISEDSQSKLQLVLPTTSNFHNPFDLIGDAPAQRYHDALDIICKDENVDAVVVILTPQTTTEIDKTAEFLVKASSNCNKPIVASFIGGDKVLSGVKILRQNNVVHVDFPENAARALSVLGKTLKTKNKELEKGSISNFGSNIISLLRYGSEADGEFKSDDATNNLRNKQQAQAIFDRYKSKGENYLPEVDAKKILELYNIPTVKSVFCKSEIEVNNLISKTFRSDQKLILKIISLDIMHKSDVGGIKANVEIVNATTEFNNMTKLVSSNLPTAKLEGILFSQMVDLSQGVEFILGAKKDPSLGTAIMFGLGGTMVELIQDVVFGFGKLERSDILQMIDQLKSKKIIQGYRGKSPLDLEAIISTIEGLSSLLSDFPQIVEVDMNPVLVGYNQSGVKILDAKIVVE
jgi:acetate---CoA ligase (ADP-forming)